MLTHGGSVIILVRRHSDGRNVSIANQLVELADVILQQFICGPGSCAFASLARPS